MSMKLQIKEKISAEEHESYELKRAGEKDAEVLSFVLKSVVRALCFVTRKV